MLLLEVHQTSARMPVAQVPGMSEGGKTSAWPCKAYRYHEQLPIPFSACLEGDEAVRDADSMMPDFGASN
jgi:hypothetical protein